MPNVPPSANGGSYSPLVDPGSANPPAIFEPSQPLIAGAPPQVWVAASGGPNWGGCLVSLSFDGVNYDYIGTISSAAYQGALTSALAAYSGSNPDITDTLAIDLTESAGLFPTAATDADARNGRTLCYVCPAFGSALFTGSISGTTLTVSAVASGTLAAGQQIFGPGVAAGTLIESGSGSSWTINNSQAVASTSMAALGSSATCPGNGELLAYGAVSATGTYTNNLTYLYRGLDGTTGAAHATGDFFTRIDLGEVDTAPNSVLTYNLPTQYIGATVYLKLQSFNVFGNALQDISDVTEYSYTPSGTGYGGGGGGVPGTPTGLTGLAISGMVALQWSPNPSGDHVEYYNVLRATASGGPYSVIGTPTNNAFSDANVTHGTTYYYEIEAVNAVGTSAASSPIAVTP
ncbi:MAG TPA: fibronectin type III domain-containing protein [Rhizomicrobium sp.]|nr:fibronectin type III domain-containing protein [Rhizomicrobium sp.]